MSLAKNKKIIILIMFLILSFFAFGCEKKTPVDNVSFNFGENQVVMYKGQSIDISNFIVVNPSNASNKSYTLSSSDSSVISVVGSRLTARGVGSALIKVSADDDSKKEDTMTIKVENAKTQLNAPSNFKYDSATQSFVFDMVEGVNKYVLKINNKEYDLGNSLSFKLEETMFDKLLTAEVKALAAKFNYAHYDSNYSQSIKAYQISKPEELKVVGGELSFAKKSNLLYNVYLDGEKIYSKTTTNSFDLKSLSAEFASQNLNYEVEAVATDGLISSLGSGVKVFESQRTGLVVKVLNEVQPEISGTMLSWDSLVGVESYKIYIDDTLANFNINSQLVSTFTSNIVDLSDWTGFENDGIKTIKVVPTLSSTSTNIALSTKVKEIKFSRLSTPNGFAIDGDKITWASVENAKVYNIELLNTQTNKLVKTSTSENSLNFASFTSGNYKITVWADTVGKVDDCNLLYSKTSEEYSFNKKSQVESLVIENKQLKFPYVANESYVISFATKNGEVEEVLNPIANGVESFDLSGYDFANGRNEIFVTISGGENSIIGDAKSVQFFQLYKVNSLSVYQDELRVVNAMANANQTGVEIILNVSGENSFEKTIGTTYSFNTTDIEGDNYLPAGSYTVNVYLKGDESATFSSEISDDVEFAVLTVPNVELLDKSEARINFNSINAVYFALKENGNSVIVANTGDSGYDITISSGEEKNYEIQAVGDGVNTLKSAVYSFSVKKLTTPTLSYDDINNAITRTAGVANETGFSSFGLDSSSWGYVLESGTYRIENVGSISGDNTFGLTSLAKDAENDIFFLNSETFELELHRVCESAVVEMIKLGDTPVDTEEKYDNKGFELHINPTDLLEPAYLKLTISVGGNETTFIETDAIKSASMTQIKDSSNNVVKTTYLLRQNGNAFAPALSYSYSEENGYYIDLLKSDFTSNLGITAGQIISITYSFLKYGNNSTSYLDSVSVTKEIQVQSSTPITRENQTIKFYDVLGDEEIEDYAVLFNGFMLTKLTNALATQMNINYDSESKYFSIDMLKVFEYINMQEENLSYEENELQIVTLNNNSTANNLTLSFAGSKISVIQTENAILTLEAVYPNVVKDGDDIIEFNDSYYKLSFDLEQYQYNKDYIISFYNKDGNNKINVETIVTKLNAFYNNRTIAINLDSNEKFSSLSGDIYISIKASSVAKHDSVETFDSFENEAYCLTKLEDLQELYIENNCLKFSQVPNVESYAIYKDNQFVTLLPDSVRSFDVSTLLGLDSGAELTITPISNKTIGGTGVTKFGKTNANSTSIQVKNMPDFESISVVAGDIVVVFDDLIQTLIEVDGVDLILHISGDSAHDVDLKNLSAYGSLTGKTLTLDPNQIVNYPDENDSALVAETLTFELEISYDNDAEITGYYYLNPTNQGSNELTVYPLFTVENIIKTTNNNNNFEAPEVISWNNNELNEIQNKNISFYYVARISYTKNSNIYTHFIGDETLTYPNNEISYPANNLLTSSSFVFPTGDNNLQFEAGDYYVDIQIVPISNEVNVVKSQYSQALTFTVMGSPNIYVENGILKWNSIDGATSYVVDIDGTEQVEIENTYFNKAFNGSLIHEIKIKSISSQSNYLNSAYSDVNYVYKIENFDNSNLTYNKVEDGNLILRVPKYFTSAKLIFTDSNNISQTITYIAEEFEEEIETFVEGDWSDYVDNDPRDYKFIRLNSDTELKNLVSGKDYTISIQFIGNDADYVENMFGIINSDIVKIARANPDTESDQKVIDLKLHKIKDDVNDVEKGIIEFGYDSAYGKDFINNNASKFNNNIGNQVSVNAFWKNAIIYKIHIEADQNYDIFAIDYNYFMFADKSDIEYNALTNLNQLKYKVKYNRDGDDLYFGVYENNKLNIKDYDIIYYYSVEESYQDGAFAYSAFENYSTINDYSEIDLTANDYYMISVYVLGGDVFEINGETIVDYGYLTSNQSTDMKTFIRYQQNAISTTLGQIQLNDLRHSTDGENYDDYPIYRLEVTPAGKTKQVVYLYYNYSDSALSDAQEIATIDAETNGEVFANAIFVPISAEANDKVLFDLSKSFSYNSSYSINVRTLAGKGNAGVNSNYLVNAKANNLISYTVYQPTNVAFVQTQTGYLSLAKSFVNVNGNNEYYSAYEILISDDNGASWYSYEINASSVGVTSSGNTYVYAIPSEIVDQYDSSKTLTIAGGDYKIKVRGIILEDTINARVLNGAYFEKDSNISSLGFTRSEGVSDVKFVDGRILWKTNEQNFLATTLVITYEQDDENYRIQRTIAPDGIVDGYYYYDFPDSQVLEENTNTYVYIQSGFNYSIGLYIIANNKINSMLSETLNFTRLGQISGSSIVSNYGVLTWAEVEGASGYNVKMISNSTYEFYSNTNSLDFSQAIDKNGLSLPLGTYSVEIRAVSIGESGTNVVNGLISNRVSGFNMISNVDSASITINATNVTWAAVENASSYKVEIVYGYAQVPDENSTVYETEVLTNSVDLPYGINGKFKVTIQAISSGNKTFNSTISSKESSSSVPLVVFDLTLDDLTYSWQVIELLESDSLHIEYEQNSYILDERANGNYSKLKYSQYEDWDIKTIIIPYASATNYLSQGRYSVTLNEIAQYRNFKVRVDRTGTASSSYVVDDEEFEFSVFGYGGGTQDNPYAILNRTQLLAVSQYATKGYNFVVKNGINLMLDQEMLNSCYEQTESGFIFKGIIAEEFVGEMDFENNILSGLDNINLNDKTEFALFKSLNNATIRNLQINSINLVNTFAYNNSNVIKLSVITIGATNSNFINIHLNESNLTITANNNVTSVILNSFKLSAVVIDATNCNFKEVQVAMQTTIGAKIQLYTVYTYISGIAVTATNCEFSKDGSTDGCKVESLKDVNDKMLNFVQDLRTNKGQPLGWVGGMVANSSNSTFNFCVSTINFEQIKATYLAQLIAQSDNSTVSLCSSNGKISYTNLENRNCYYGGLIGRASSTIINSNTTTVDFRGLSCSYTDNYIRIGVIVGSLEGNSQLANNTINSEGYTGVEKTQLGSPIIIGKYGYA